MKNLTPGRRRRSFKVSDGPTLIIKKDPKKLRRWSPNTPEDELTLKELQTETAELKKRFGSEEFLNKLLKKTMVQ